MEEIIEKTAESKIKYYVLPMFTSEMERVQFMTIYGKNIFECSAKEAAEKKKSSLMADTKKRKISCDFRIVTKKQ